MRRMLCAVAALMLCAGACAQVRVTAVNVGKGDALIVQADGYTCMIDTGKKKAQEQIEAVLAQLDIDALDAVFITHTDKDHVGGLKWLDEGDIGIGAIYASGYYAETTYEKHEAVEAAQKLDMEVNWLFAGDSVPLGASGAVFHVLAPEMLIPENENDNSLVMMLDSPDGHMLFTGDMEYVQEGVLLAAGHDLRCDVLKVANHGDSDATSNGLIEACGAKIAVISTSTEEKEDTPDPYLLGMLERAGCETFITQECSFGVEITLDNGQAFAQYRNW